MYLNIFCCWCRFSDAEEEKTNKFCATCRNWHLFWLAIFSSCWNWGVQPLHPIGLGIQLFPEVRLCIQKTKSRQRQLPRIVTQLTNGGRPKKESTSVCVSSGWTHRLSASVELSPPGGWWWRQGNRGGEKSTRRIEPAGGTSLLWLPPQLPLSPR